jgi:endonuclease YncB( thermonuclease family)
MLKYALNLRCADALDRMKNWSRTFGGGMRGHPRQGAMPLLLAFLVLLLGLPRSGLAEEPAGAPAAGGTIEEWLNQTVRLRDTVQVLDQPSTDGKPTSRIRAGAEVKAIGLVGGGRWVKIELADQQLGYVPADAIRFEDKPAPSSAAGPPGTEAPAATTPPAPSSAASPPAAGSSSPTVLKGLVTRVPNAATLVVADQRIRLSGIDPGPPGALSPFETWVRSQGALQCEPEAQTGRFRCLTGGGIDVAEAAILNGSGRVGAGAPPGYREREIEARQAHRGLWAQP